MGSRIYCRCGHPQSKHRLRSDTAERLALYEPAPGCRICDCTLSWRGVVAWHRGQPLEPSRQRELRKHRQADGSYSRKIRLTHAELLDLFSSDCNTFGDIAVFCGVTRQRIHQIYDRDFKHLVPLHKTGHDRHKVCTRKRRIHKVKQSLLADPVLLSIVEKASSHGVVAAPVAFTNGTTASSKYLRLNGYVCLIACATRSWPIRKGAGTQYYRVARRGYKHMDHKFLIAVLPGQTLVIPREAADTVRGKVIYINLHGPSGYNNIRPVVDWFQYSDRWDLLSTNASTTEART